jgi:hypothetical protein
MIKNKYDYSVTTERVPYVYLVRQKSTGLWYIGSKFSRDAHPTKFFVTYFTSSSVIHSALTADGLDSFEYRILKTFKYQHEATEYEHRLLKRLKATTNPNSLNRDANLNPSSVIHVKYPTKFISNPTTGECFRVHINKTLPDGWVLGNINFHPSKQLSTRRWFYDPLSGESYHIAEQAEDHWLPGRGPNYTSNRDQLKAKNLMWFTDGKTNRICAETDAPIGWATGRTKTHVERTNNAQANRKRHARTFHTPWGIFQTIPDAIESTTIPVEWSYVDRESLRSYLKAPDIIQKNHRSRIRWKTPRECGFYYLE